VLETVSLDLYLLRQIGMMLRNIPSLEGRTDIVGLVDEFAGRFYDELDYVVECDNGIRMAKDMASLPMVVIPKCYPDYTSRRVHVAEWIDGEKLAVSEEDDVQDLVNVGVVAYLTQLLDGGFFHADPHPGNMIRTTDGNLAIIDFGLMTELTPDQQEGILESVVHLINRDYTQIGKDFQRLDFISKDIDVRPIEPALTRVFDAALQGGGAKAINFNDLSADLATITFDYPFRIPPYFALVIRAISVLEGIALVGKPDFAIIDEAFPYISQRLLTADSPQLRATLREFIYDKDGIFDAERLIELLGAFEEFDATKGMAGGYTYGTGDKDEKQDTRVTTALAFFLFGERQVSARLPFGRDRVRL
jgi:aarF domain-containing kinase